MARCGCNKNCTCRINGEACMVVTGLGSPTNPYKFRVDVDDVTVTCSGAGLNRIIFYEDTNTIDISGAGTAGDPLRMDVILTPNAQVPDPDGLGVGNMIKIGPTGIYVSCEDVQDCVGAALADMLVGDCLVYDDTANAMTLQICPELNGLECVPVGDANCPAGGLAVFPSSDPNNALTIGTDGRLFAPAFAIAAGDCLEPITQAGTPADPFILDPQVAPELNGLECIPGVGLSVFPSGDPDNALTFGTDNRLFADICFNTLPTEIRIGEVGPCIETAGDGCLDPFRVILRLSDDPCQGLCCNADGLFVYQNNTEVPGIQGLFSENWSVPPQNGNFDDRVVMAPRCMDVTNPSQCKTMLVSILFGGVVAIQKLSGNFVVQFQTSLTGPGGPWNTAVSAAALDPDPPSPQPVSLISPVNGSVPQVVELAPGASQQICFRIVLDGFALVNGQIANSDRSAAATFQWNQSVNTC